VLSLLISETLMEQLCESELPDNSSHPFFGDPPEQYIGATIYLNDLVPPGMVMTATAIMRVGGGFAVAADGNQLWQHKRTRTAAICDREIHNAQKIFSIEKEGTTLVYVVRGDIANEDRTFDVTAELKREAVFAVKKHRSSPKKLAAFIGDALERQITAALENGRLEDWLAPQIELFGFVGKEPFRISLNFSPCPVNSGLHYKIIPRKVVDDDNHEWLFVCSGSPTIEWMTKQWDVRIRRFIKKQPNANMSLQDAIDTTQGYIEACSSSLGLEVDPVYCQGLGGDTHVATAIPRTRPSWFARCFGHGQRAWSGGFKWIIPPKNFDHQ
jgi:hypothetical protein